MDRPRFAFRIIALLTSLLATACATNMTSAATFGGATSTVAQQTNAVLTKIPQSCRDQLDLLSGQLALANSVIVPSASNTGAFAPHTTYPAQQRLAPGDYA